MSDGRWLVTILNGKVRFQIFKKRGVLVASFFLWFLSFVFGFALRRRLDSTQNLTTELAVRRHKLRARCMVRHGYTLRRYTVPAAHEGWYTPIICRGATLLTRLCGCPLWLIHVCEALAEERCALMRTYTR